MATTYNLITDTSTLTIPTDKNDNYPIKLCAVLADNNNTYTNNLNNIKIGTDIIVESDQTWCVPTFTNEYTDSTKTGAVIKIKVDENTTDNSRIAKLKLKYKTLVTSNYSIIQQSKKTQTTDKHWLRFFSNTYQTDIPDMVLSTLEEVSASIQKLQVSDFVMTTTPDGTLPNANDFYIEIDQTLIVRQSFDKNSIRPLTSISIDSGTPIYVYLWTYNMTKEQYRRAHIKYTDKNNNIATTTSFALNNLKWDDKNIASIDISSIQ